MKHIILIASFLFAQSIFAQSSVVADVTLNPVGDFKAKMSNVKGFATQSGDTIRAENIVVNLNSLSTGLGLRDDHAKNKYLNVKEHPEAVLVKAIGKGGKGKGILRLRGIEKQVDGTYSVDGKMLKAKFDFKLSDYGISDISYKGVGVEDKVSVAVTVPIQEGEAKPAAKPADKKAPAPKK